MMARDKFSMAASFIVEEHIRIYDKMVPHPDMIKNAIARELEATWNEAIGTAESVVGGLRQGRG